MRGLKTFERNAKQSFIHEFNRFLKFARKKGFDRGDHETVREMMQRWRRQSNWLSQDLEQLVHMFERVKYGRMEVNEGTLQQAFSLIDNLRKQMK